MMSFDVNDDNIRGGELMVDAGSKDDQIPQRSYEEVSSKSHDSREKGLDKREER